MKTSIDLYFPKPTAARRRNRMRAWLVHVDGGVPGFIHWIVCAPSLEEAFQLALDLPGAKEHGPKLGRLFDAHGWPDFSRQKLQMLCDTCTPKGDLLLSIEERTWQSYVDQLHLQPKEHS